MRRPPCQLRLSSFPQLNARQMSYMEPLPPSIEFVNSRADFVENFGSLNKRIFSEYLVRQTY